jgi:hypothetical protein
MAADIGLSDGFLQLHGTDQNDVAEIFQQGDLVIVDYSQFDASGQLLDSRQESYSRGEVQGVYFQGDAGDDVLINGSDLPAIALGGAGNDVLIGGSADDVVSGGCGDDRMSGGAGNDILLGGSGDNVLFDASGIDASDSVTEADPAEPPVEVADEPVSLVDETQPVEESLPEEDSQLVDESLVDESTSTDDSSEQGCADDEVTTDAEDSSSDVTPAAEPLSPVDPPVEVAASDVVPSVDEPSVEEIAVDETVVDEAPVPDPLDCPLEESPLPPEDVSSEPVVIVDNVEPEPFVGPILVGVAIDDYELADETSPPEAPPAEAPPTQEPLEEAAPTVDEVLPLEETASPAAVEVSEELSLGGNDILVGGAGADLLLGGEGDDGLFGDELPAELMAQLTLNQFSWFQGGNG